MLAVVQHLSQLLQPAGISTCMPVISTGIATDCNTFRNHSKYIKGQAEECPFETRPLTHDTVFSFHPSFYQP